ncbi:MAG: Mur ligase family protein [Candidatus Colwellbacteria bacterium]|jgi:UDP-N-acetylmuramoyl-L-alanyl-D-glutamate--2,6-diaminopimelate ligase|nr:Mur ligase family protein [Candidatus Colwellbacteria bacterium]MDD3752366.1 Mur ligase family protein [Candidatus Colwellbacteria bacterium]MDD4818568.1 Mur ligase family protein [Candidatus Colwellbacteria bacterium]
MIKRLKNIYHYLLAWLSNILCGNPSRKLYVIGVTGTKGKSMTAELIATALNACGKRTAIISSAHIVIGEKEDKNFSGNTMPGRGKIQRILKKAVKEGCRYAVIEATSEGVLQHRHKFIEWDAAVLTNLHPEHIEHHGSFENYREAKLGFFRYAACSPKQKKLFFINKEDENAEYFSEAAGDNQKIFFKGVFLKANYAAAIAVAESQGCNADMVGDALFKFKGLSGRVETITEKPFKVIVDYAHTPDSLEEVCKWAALPFKIEGASNKKMICVLGSAGGGRDKWKRPKMGEIASRYCDEIIITNEDPYDEDPMEIINSVAEGAEKSSKKVFKIIDRQEAIDKAVTLANEGDVVILTGKGSEPYIHLAKGKKIEWSEKEAVMKAIKDRNSV